MKENTPLCREHFRLVLLTKTFPPTRAGQFIQLACRNLDLEYDPQRELEWREGQAPALEGRELGGPLAFLRRPFSLAGRRDTTEGTELHLIYRTVGVGTAWLADLKAGDAAQVIGPLGNSFEHPPEGGLAILVGGGVGIPPMMYLASELAGRRAVAFCGATRRDLLSLTITADAPAPSSDSIEPLYNVGEFAGHGVPAIITTDDGSYGFHGLVTVAIERYLDRFFDASDARRGVVLYTCGPEPMMKRVATIAMERGLASQIAVERAMACGMGTCQSCVIRVKRPTANGDRPWVYKLACTDGPVFRGDELLW